MSVLKLSVVLVIVVMAPALTGYRLTRDWVENTATKIVESFEPQGSDVSPTEAGALAEFESQWWFIQQRVLRITVESRDPRISTRLRGLSWSLGRLPARRKLWLKGYASSLCDGVDPTDSQRVGTCLELWQAFGIMPPASATDLLFFATGGTNKPIADYVPADRRSEVFFRGLGQLMDARQQSYSSLCSLLSRLEPEEWQSALKRLVQMRLEDPTRNELTPLFSCGPARPPRESLTAVATEALRRLMAAQSLRDARDRAQGLVQLPAGSYDRDIGAGAASFLLSRASVASSIEERRSYLELTMQFSRFLNGESIDCVARLVLADVSRAKRPAELSYVGQVIRALSYPGPRTVNTIARELASRIRSDPDPAAAEAYANTVLQFTHQLGNSSQCEVAAAVYSRIQRDLGSTAVYGLASALSRFGGACVTSVQGAAVYDQLVLAFLEGTILRDDRNLALAVLSQWGRTILPADARRVAEDLWKRLSTTPYGSALNVELLYTLPGESTYPVFKSMGARMMVDLASRKNEAFGTNLLAFVSHFQTSMTDKEKRAIADEVMTRLDYARGADRDSLAAFLCRLSSDQPLRVWDYLFPLWLRDARFGESSSAWGLMSALAVIGASLPEEKAEQELARLLASQRRNTRGGCVASSWLIRPMTAATVRDEVLKWPACLGRDSEIRTALSQQGVAFAQLGKTGDQVGQAR